MFARQGIDAVEAFFQCLLPLWVGIEVIEKAIEFADRFFNLYLRTGQQIDGLAKRAGLVLKSSQALQARGQR